MEIQDDGKKTMNIQPYQEIMILTKNQGQTVIDNNN